MVCKLPAQSKKYTLYDQKFVDTGPSHPYVLLEPLAPDVVPLTVIRTSTLLGRLSIFLDFVCFRLLLESLMGVTVRRPQTFGRNVYLPGLEKLPPESQTVL